jgi:hypothetical protein
MRWAFVISFAVVQAVVVGVSFEAGQLYAYYHMAQEVRSEAKKAVQFSHEQLSHWRQVLDAKKNHQ